MDASSPPPPDATVLLNAAADGDKVAADRLLPLVYAQLRKAAQLQMAAERPDHTLSATALVHEAYLKLVGARQVPWAGRRHFYAAAAEAMRRILIDHARSHLAGQARDEQARRAALHIPGVESLLTAANLDGFLALDEGLVRLESEDAQAAAVVRLRFYAGLDVAQTALALGVSERTIKRDWAFARGWLRRRLEQAEGQ